MGQNSTAPHVCISNKPPHAHITDERSSRLSFYFCTLWCSRQPTIGAHLDFHASTFFFFFFFFHLWGFTSCEIPSSWKYHRRHGWRWLLSKHLKCVCWYMCACAWDQGCIEATCHSAPVCWRKCSSPLNHKMHTYTKIHKCTLATCTVSYKSCNTFVVVNICNCVTCGSSCETCISLSCFWLICFLATNGLCLLRNNKFFFLFSA